MESLARVLLPVLNLCFMLCTAFFIASIFTPSAAIIFSKPTKVKGMLFWGISGFVVMVLAAVLFAFQPAPLKL